MNKTLNKILCKYFSNDKNIVTVGSVIDFGIFYTIIALIIIGIFYAMYSSIYAIQLFA